MASKSIQVTVEPRPQLGSRANKRLRDAGKLPGVIYGHKQDVVPVTLPKKEVVTHLSKGAHIFELAVEGKAETVLVKEVQYDPFGIEVLHVDFARVSLDERVTLTVPIEIKGEPKGEADGGVLQQIMNELEIECLVTDIPDAIRVNVSDLGLDGAIHVKELQLPGGVKALADEDQLVVAVRAIQEEESEEPAEGAAEPEVIGRKPEEAEAAK